MNLLNQDDFLSRRNIENPYTDDEQVASFIPSIDPETHLPYQSTKGFDENASSLIVNEIETRDELLFGEHFREAKQIIKTALKK